MTDAATAQRKSLRTNLKRQRLALTQRQQQQHAQALLKQFLRSPWAWGTGGVASYLAGNGEIDPSFIHQHCWASLRPLAAPVVRGQQLEFYRLQPNAVLSLNRFGLREPDTGARFVDTRSFSIMLVPLLGFDGQGNRLGMGGGYYDRHLGKLAPALRPKLVGVGHAHQELAEIKAQPWDIPLDGVLTEQGWQRFSNR